MQGSIYTHLAEFVDSSTELPETTVNQMDVERILQQRERERERDGERRAEVGS